MFLSAGVHDGQPPVPGQALCSISEWVRPDSTSRAHADAAPKEASAPGGVFAFEKCLLPLSWIGLGFEMWLELRQKGRSR